MVTLKPSVLSRFRFLISLVQLDAGNVDAIVAVETFISLGLASGLKAISWPYVATAPDLPVALLITSGTIAAERPELV